MEYSGIFEVDKWIQAYLILKLFDFITGFSKACINKNWRSAKLREGILFVLLELIAIIFSGILDQLLNLEFLLMATKMLFVFKECLSIVENLKEIGIILPNSISDAIATINPDKENKEE